MKIGTGENTKYKASSFAQIRQQQQGINY